MIKEPARGVGQDKVSMVLSEVAMEIWMPWAGLGRVVRRWFEIDRLRRELASIDGATRAELRLHAPGDAAALARNAWREPGQLQRMLERVGVSEHPSLDNWGYRRELEHTCALCSVARTCRRWLASGDREGYQAFCPNAVELSAMAADRRTTLESVAS